MNRSTSKSTLRLAAALLSVAALVAACGSSSSSGLSGNSGPAGSTTVVSEAIGGQSVLVAGANGMTLYTFGSDVAGSGTSACSGSCLTKWPALTVAAGITPTAGSGVAGPFGTFTRADNGAIQVTYKGLPLHFYSGDKAAGDTNGNYPGWSLAQP